ncbi:MAG: rubredoxin [Alphaproteobacteria bacterium]
MPKHRCNWCGYVYDSAEGDPARGIPPGTLFDALPADWCCPDCRAPKTDFSWDSPSGSTPTN